MVDYFFPQYSNLRNQVYGYSLETQEVSNNKKYILLLMCQYRECEVLIMPDQSQRKVLEHVRLRQLSKHFGPFQASYIIHSERAQTTLNHHTSSTSTTSL